MGSPPTNPSPLPWPRYRFRLKLRVAIAASLFFVTVSLAVTMTIINHRGSTSALRTATGELMLSSIDLLAAETEALLEQVAARVEVSAVVLGHHPERLETDLEAVEMLLFALVESGRDLHYAQFGAADGRFVLVRRNAEGGLDTKWVVDGQTTWTRRHPGQGLRAARARTTDPDDDYDPRRRPWYRGGAGADGLFWTRAYAHADSGDPVVTAARAIRGPDGDVFGVVSATLALSHLNRFLGRLSTSSMLIFVADEREQLIAISDGSLHIGRDDPNALELPHLEDAPFPEIVAIGHSDFLHAPQANGVGLHRVAAAGDDYLAVVRALTPMAGREWTVGAVVEEAAVLSGARGFLRTSAGVAAAVIGVFVLLGLALARTLAGPLLAIARETRRIERLELEDVQLDASRFEEIAEIQKAYAHLKVGLRAFQKYVPVKLVRTLLAERVDPEPGGHEQEITLFFSDIRGFTSFAHGLSAQELAEVLSLYLQKIVDEIDGSGGTVDKFIGDGVMAFWNAPRHVPEHPLEAVRTAIRSRDAIRTMARASHLFTRIGVHTGRAVVGNFGSPSRFSYTALGDTVNLASRLESVNKRYGTEIIVSGVTEARLDESIVRRKLDRISVAGRTEGFDIFEVLGFTGQVDASRVARAKRYESALAAYFDRRFHGALDELQAILSEDPAAAALAERCRCYAAQSPPSDWDGVYALEDK